MPECSTKERWSIALVVCLCVLHSGCGHFDGAQADPESGLRKRVANYWDALVADDVQTAFLFFEPFAQDEQHRNRYVTGMRKFKYLSYTIEGVQLEGDRAAVRVQRTFLLKPDGVPLPIKPISQTITNAWVRVDGTWYAVFIKPGSLFSLDPKALKPNALHPPPRN